MHINGAPRLWKHAALKTFQVHTGADREKTMEIKREHHINFWYIIAALIAIMLIQNFFIQATRTKTIPYSEFQQLVDQGGVSDVVVGQTTITGTLKDAKATEPQ